MTATTQPLRAGVIGLGAGRFHTRAYAALADVDLVALCDLDADRLVQFGADYPDARHYTDYHKMFGEADLDIVSIAVPNKQHPTIAIDALEAGLHVVCEKPLAADLPGAEKIAEAARKAKTKFTISYDKRYRADTLWLHQAVQQGTLGQIYHVEAGWKRETGIPGGWFSDKAVAGGGPLIDLGVHVLDAALWALGFPKVQTVSGVTRAVFGPSRRKTWARGHKSGEEPGYGVEDGAVGLIRLAGNIPLILEASWADHRRPGEDDMYFRFAGSEGAAEVHIRNYTQVETLCLYTEVGGTPVEAKPYLRPTEQHGHTLLIHQFINAIRSDTAPPAPAEQGLVTMRVLDAFYRSAESGRELVLES